MIIQIYTDSSLSLLDWRKVIQTYKDISTTIIITITITSLPQEYSSVTSCLPTF